MTIIRRNPAQEFSEMQNRLWNLLGRSPIPAEMGKEESITVAEWAPPVDITEDEKEFLIKAELPGLTKDQVKVTVENGVLSISGERKVEKEEKTKKFHRIERAYGSFVRSFALPDGTDGTKVDAEFKEGLLSVRVLKTEKTKPKSVPIS